MADGSASTSFFRPGSVRLLVCGALLCAALLLTGMYLPGALALFGLAAAAWALRRTVDEACRDRCSGGCTDPSAPKPTWHQAVGIADRQTLEAALDAEWTTEHRPGEPTTLVLIALDGFDHLQEQGGAVAEDVAMLTLANALRRSLPRQADLLARFDRSTFAVLLRGTDLPGSLRVAARLRWAIVRLGIANARTTSGFLTACMGLAVQHGRCSGGTPALLAAAESILGSAQRAGDDGLEYVVLGSQRRPPESQDQPALVTTTLPAIRAWTSKQA